jgi:hypothetical protein
MYRLPANVLSDADQSKAHTDQVIAGMVASLRSDLAEGIDLTTLWWTLSRGFNRDPETTKAHLAVGLAAAILQLATRDAAPDA